MKISETLTVIYYYKFRHMLKHKNFSSDSQIHTTPLKISNHIIFSILNYEFSFYSKICYTLFI